MDAVKWMLLELKNTNTPKLILPELMNVALPARDYTFNSIQAPKSMH